MSKLSCETARAHAGEARRGRLGDSEAEELAVHFETCATCRAQHLRDSALDAALARLPRPPAPAALSARLRDLAEARPRRLRRRVGVAAALVAAAALVLLGFFGLRYRSEKQSELLASEAVSDHLRILYAERGPEVESGGMHQVKPWFEGRLDFAPVLNFDGDDEFALVGGSVALFRERKAAAFAFKHRLHRITLLVFRADGLVLPREHAEQPPPGQHLRLRGFDVVLWKHDDLGYALVSDTAASTLDKLATKIVTAK